MDDLSKYYFLPLQEVENFVNKIKTRKINSNLNKLCTKSLLDLQRKRNLLPPRSYGHGDWKLSFGTALKRSVMTQDWDKLQTLLGETPIWEMDIHGESTHNVDNYIRALIILLMYHPSAKAQNLLHEYMHMVLGCRTDEDKKALTKILIAIPDKYPKRGAEE